MGLVGALQPLNLVAGLVGGIVGTVVGALPGIGPVGGIALLLPLTYTLPTSTGLILLTSIYMGCMYGGRITSIVINVPGDAHSACTCFDGYPLMKQGKGGLALGISAVSSFWGGILGGIGLILFSPQIVKMALAFGPPEYFALMVFGLVAISTLTQGSVIKGISMTVLGLLLGMVGFDYITGLNRYTLGYLPLMDGLSFGPIAVGLFGLSEVLINVQKKVESEYEEFKYSIREMIPDRKSLKQSMPAATRGSLLGFLIGALPGAGATIATFVAYAVEKRISKTPERFGKGALEGLAAPEAADNACVPGAMVPLLSLGIPGSAATAMLMGALIAHNLQPGPLLFRNSPDVVWGLMVSILVVNVLLLLLNTCMIPAFIWLVRSVERVLNPIIVFLCLAGVYVIDGSMTDVIIAIICGLVGFLMKKCDYPIAPLVLALILGPLAETNMRTSLLMSRGSASIFATRPISAGFLAISIGLLLWPVFKKLIKRPIKKPAS